MDSGRKLLQVLLVKGVLVAVINVLMVQLVLNVKVLNISFLILLLHLVKILVVFVLLVIKQLPLEFVNVRNVFQIIVSNVMDKLILAKNVQLILTFSIIMYVNYVIPSLNV